MLEKLESLERKYKALSEELSSGVQDYGSNVYLLKLKEHKVLEELMGRYEGYKGVLLKISETEELLSVEEDEELKELVREELNDLLRQRDVVEQELRLRLLPKDANEDKNVIMEIRAGTGGDEAALFASDLYRMYVKYADRNVMKVEQLSASPTEGGGYKEVIFSVSGDAVYNKLKFEMGGHRVQRVPVTESSGRIHTSAVTVAVLAEAEETEVEINPNDLRIDVYRSSGPGGQSVNTTDSAVRITHIKHGITVQCQDEKSQHKNKAKAMRVLRARIKDKLEEERAKDLKEERARQIGSGDRSERIRTYNFQQNRMTDHRINYSIYNKLESLLNGEIEEFIEKLQEKEKEDKLKSLT